MFTSKRIQPFANGVPLNKLFLIQVGDEEGSGEYEIAELNNLDQNTSLVEDEESADEMIAEEDDQLMMGKYLFYTVCSTKH